MSRTSFDEARFEADFERTIDRCEELNRDEALQFVQTGYVRVTDAFPRSIAETVVEHAWEELERDYEVDRADPASWDRPMMFHRKGGIHGYVRVPPSGTRFNLPGDAPRAFRAQTDAIGGASRLPDGGANLAWSDASVANLGVAGHPGREQPQPQLGGWHKDGWHFRHFLNSPEQGLLTVPIYSDIAPDSGGTHVAVDSIAPVARLLAAHPEGLHPDSVQGAGYLIPGLVEQCSAFEELTGDAGDMVILHPFMIHRACINPSPRPRFIANAALVLTEPMNFAREAGDAYSLVELAVLWALKMNRLEFATTRDRLAVLPGPMRKDEDTQRERELLQAEMSRFADVGHRTPAWGREHGYQSNRA